MVDVNVPSRCSGMDTGLYQPSLGHSTESASVDKQGWDD